MVAARDVGTPERTTTDRLTPAWSLGRRIVEQPRNRRDSLCPRYSRLRRVVPAWALKLVFRMGYRPVKCRTMRFLQEYGGLAS